MVRTASPLTRPTSSRLDRALSLFTDIRAGEGATALLMLLNIFLLLVCYSVIKTVREPLILLGGGAEVRSYAAAGQALLLMGFVPLYSWFAARVDRGEAARRRHAVLHRLHRAVRARSGGAACRTSASPSSSGSASSTCRWWRSSGRSPTTSTARRRATGCFPIIVIGMTAGAPLGSFIAGRLFHAGLTPQVILQIAAVLLASACCSTGGSTRRERAAARAAQPRRRRPPAGSRLVLGNRYLRLIALLVVLLNVVNTTGEYLVARLLTTHVKELALADAAFNKQAYIGAFSGDYQFWVNVIALPAPGVRDLAAGQVRGLARRAAGAAADRARRLRVVAAGVGFSVVRWIKTAENATDYSIMNTARQLLWLPTSRDEKYKAKQAIDTFFVRGGDVLSAVAVYLGASVLHLERPAVRDREHRARSCGSASP